MELYEILDTIVHYDKEKPWEVIIHQVLFYCLRVFCLKRVIESYEDASPEIDWENIFELCRQHCDPSFQKHLNEIFDPEHFNQIEDVELLDIFCKRFIESLDVVIKNDILDNEFIQFLDVTLFEYFAKTLDGTDVYIFPRNIEDTLQENVLVAFIEKLRKPDNDDLLNSINIIHTPTELNTEFYKKNTLAHAVKVKRHGILKTLKHNHTSLTQTRKVRSVRFAASASASAV